MGTTLHLPANAPGHRGIATKAHGDVLLAPGEVREDLDLTDDELKAALSNDLLKGKPKEEAAADEAATVSEEDTAAAAEREKAAEKAAAEAAKPAKG